MRYETNRPTRKKSGLFVNSSRTFCERYVNRILRKRNPMERLAEARGVQLKNSGPLSLPRRSLGRFAQVVMPAYEIEPCHQLMIDRLEQLLSGKIKKLAIIMPPRHGKTTLGNVIAPAYALGRNPTETVISASYGSELSETFGRRVRSLAGSTSPVCPLIKH
jgi:hypothetical protein